MRPTILGAAQSHPRTSGKSQRRVHRARRRHEPNERRKRTLSMMYLDVLAALFEALSDRGEDVTVIFEQLGQHATVTLLRVAVSDLNISARTQWLNYKKMQSIHQLI